MKEKHPFMIKTFITLSREGTYINIIKAKSNEPTANIMLKGEN